MALAFVLVRRSRLRAGACPPISSWPRSGTGLFRCGPGATRPSRARRV